MYQILRDSMYLLLRNFAVGNLFALLMLVCILVAEHRRSSLIRIKMPGLTAVAGGLNLLAQENFTVLILTIGFGLGFWLSARAAH